MKLTKPEVQRLLKVGLQAQFAAQKFPHQVEAVSIEDFEFDVDGNLETLEIDVTYRPITVKTP